MRGGQSEGEGRGDWSGVKGGAIRGRGKGGLIGGEGGGNQRGIEKIRGIDRRGVLRGGWYWEKGGY